MNIIDKILKVSLDVICIIDEEGKFSKVSSASKKLWDYEPEELEGTSFWDLIYPDDLEKTKAAAIAIYEGKELTSFENRYIRKDGKIAYNLWSASIDPESKLMYCTARDASDKLNKELLLKESELRFKALVQDGSDLIGILDEAGNYIYVSPTSTAILGMNPEEFIGKNAISLIHPEDQERTLACLLKISEQLKIMVDPFRFQNSKGDWRWMETVLTNMLDNPAVKGIVANSRDITDQINKEQHMKLLESVIINTNDIVLITEAEPFDQPGPRIVYINEAFTRLTGYTTAEVIGKTPRILQGPKSDRAELDRISKCLRNWESVESTVLNYKKNGDEMWIHMSISPVANEKGWFTHWISIERDVTEQKNQQIINNSIAKISNIFNIDAGLHNILQHLCKELIKLGDINFCEVWLKNTQGNFLEFKNFESSDNTERLHYSFLSDATFLEKGVELPGKVWEKQQKIICELDGLNHELFKGVNEARKLGIKTLIGYPIFHQQNLIGVLKIGSKLIEKDIKMLSQVLENVGTFIGSEIIRKKTEIELAKIFEFAPDIITITGFDGFIKSINPYASLVLGYDEAEFKSKPFVEFIHPNDVIHSIETLQNLGNGKPQNNFQNRLITKGGKIKTISWNVSPSIEDGLIFAIGKDITEELKITELLKDATELSRIGSWEVDLKENTIYWSKTVYQIHELDTNYIPDLSSAISFYKEEYQEMVKDNLEKSIATKQPFDFEAIIVTSKKNEVWVRAIGKAEFINNECVRIYGSFQDINEQKITENRLQALSDNLPGVIFKYTLFPDGSDKLDYVSKGANVIWGISPEMAMNDINLIWDQIKAGGNYDQVVKDIQNSIINKKLWTSEWKNVLPDGKIRWHLGYGTPNLMADGSIVFNSMILDITQERKAQNLLKEASNMALIGNWEVNLQDQTVYLSDITKDIHELTLDQEISFEEGINFYREDVRDFARNTIEQGIAEGTAWDFELPIITAKGNEKWIRGIGQAEKINGVPVRLFGSFQDIHERKSAEIQRNKTLEEKNKILESIGDAFFAIDKNLTITYWNKAAEDLIKITRAETVGKHLLEVFPIINNNPTYLNYLKVLKSGLPVSFEEHNNLWFEVNAYPTDNGVSIFFRDISFRKEKDRILFEANERFEKVTEITTDAIYDWNIKNDKFYLGNGFEKLFGYKITKNISAKDFTNRFYPKDSEKINRSLESALINPKINRWEQEYCIIHRSGKAITVLDKGTILRDNDGNAIRMIGAMTDITYQKEYEDELLKLNRTLQTHFKDLKTAYQELEQFTYIASHDLQEPLRMVSSFLDQLKRKYENQLDEKAHQYIYFASDGAKRMKQIILDLLEYSRAGKNQEENELVDLNKIIEDYQFLRRKIIEEKQVNLILGKLPSIKAYKTPLVQVFNNILDNAIKYTEKDKSPIIEISIEEIENAWKIKIKDNGIGINQKYFEKIFIIFQRLHDREQYAGTGIGLSIVKKHVEFWGGKLWLESIENKGSVFYFTIPFYN